jgi:hypothetical protein
MHVWSRETRAGNFARVSRATLALRYLSRLVIHIIKSYSTGNPLDIDAMAFWAHGICAKAALVHIKYSVRDEQWESELEVLKTYLRFFKPRYKIYGM